MAALEERAQNAESLLELWPLVGKAPFGSHVASQNAVINTVRRLRNCLLDEARAVASNTDDVEGARNLGHAIEEFRRLGYLMLMSVDSALGDRIGHLSQNIEQKARQARIELVEGRAREAVLHKSLGLPPVADADAAAVAKRAFYETTLGQLNEACIQE